VLRLPNGTFTPYSPGTKTNVVFFTKGSPTETTWVYDARTNVPRVTKKDRPLSAAHLAAFEVCFGTDPYGRARRDPRDSWEGRWRPFSIAEVMARQFKIDSLKWLRDDSLDDGDDLLEPLELADEAMSELHSAILELTAVRHALEPEKEEGDSEAGKEATVLRGVR
jgi:type I restriction enzyme M protein